MPATRDFEDEAKRVLEAKARMHSLTLLEREIEAEYKERKSALQKEIAEVRELCPHPRENSIYCPDASGNNDSYHYCQICGAEW